MIRSTSVNITEQVTEAESLDARPRTILGYFHDLRRIPKFWKIDTRSVRKM